MALQIKIQLPVVGDDFFCLHLYNVSLCIPTAAMICFACSSVQCFEINSFMLSTQYWDKMPVGLAYFFFFVDDFGFGFDLLFGFGLLFFAFDLLELYIMTPI
jgi:hypothetical protein